MTIRLSCCLATPVALAALLIVVPASAQARSCGTHSRLADGTRVKVDAYSGASCSFARATATRFYALDGVPRHLKVKGTRLTYRRQLHGRGWRTWTYRGRRKGRVAVVSIRQVDPPAPPVSPPPVSPPTAPQPECDPNYAGACLDPDAADYDCSGGAGDGPFYTEQVMVVGDDHFELDRDGDGVGCD